MDRPGGITQPKARVSSQVLFNSTVIKTERPYLMLSVLCGEEQKGRADLGCRYPSSQAAGRDKVNTGCWQGGNHPMGLRFYLEEWWLSSVSHCRRAHSSEGCVLGSAVLPGQSMEG